MSIVDGDMTSGGAAVPDPADLQALTDHTVMKPSHQYIVNIKQSPPAISAHGRLQYTSVDFVVLAGSTDQENCDGQKLQHHIPVDKRADKEKRDEVALRLRSDEDKFNLYECEHNP